MTVGAGGGRSGSAGGCRDRWGAKAAGPTPLEGGCRPPELGEAEALAAALLGGMPDRLRHVRAVAGRAAELAGAVPDADRVLLVVTAWLHDIGYAPALRATGFHPLDGAAYLDRLGWPPRVSSLVAHHSGARFVAAELGLLSHYRGHPQEISPLSDALSYADQTVGPQGQRLALADRMADMLARHGPDSPNARAHHRRAPYLRAIAARVERRLAESAAPAASADPGAGARPPDRRPAVVRAVSRRHPGLPPARVHMLVWAAFARFDPAPVQTFVPLLAQREVERQLRREAARELRRDERRSG